MYDHILQNTKTNAQEIITFDQKKKKKKNATYISLRVTS